MNPAAVMEEIGAAVTSIDKQLRVFPYPAKKVTPPAVIVDLPDDGMFSATYQRGMDQLTIDVTVVVGFVSAEASAAELCEYISGSGPRSVRRAIEDHLFATCDAATVVSFETSVVIFAAVQYLGATFSVDVKGKGTG